MNNDIIIEADGLGELEVFPPRRTFKDLLPQWARRALRAQSPTARELWFVSSQLLRLFYTSLYRAEPTKSDNPNTESPTTPKDFSELN